MSKATGRVTGESERKSTRKRVGQEAIGERGEQRKSKGKKKSEQVESAMKRFKESTKAYQHCCTRKALSE